MTLNDVENTTLEEKALAGANVRWTVIRGLHGWWAYGPFNDNRDSYYLNYSDALTYAIKQAKLDAVYEWEKRLNDHLGLSYKKRR